MGGRSRGYRTGTGYGVLSTGNHRPDFDVILVGEHLVFRDQLIAADDQVRFNHEIQLAQDILRPLRAFEIHRSRGMTELDAHRPIICFR